MMCQGICARFNISLSLFEPMVMRRLLSNIVTKDETCPLVNLVGGVEDLLDSMGTTLSTVFQVCVLPYVRREY